MLRGNGNDHLIVILMITFFIHFPFGVRASSYKKYSRPWARCLYVPIVLTIILRRVTGAGYAFIPYLIIAALSAQLSGRRLGGHRMKCRMDEEIKVDLKPDV